MHQLLMYILLFFIFAVSDTIPQQSRDVFLTPLLRSSLRIPVGNAGDHWEHYPTTGLIFEFPSEIPHSLLLAGFEAGIIWNKKGTVSISCLHLQLGISYIYQTPLKFISLLSSVGLASTMISEQDVTKFDDVAIFSNVENEFGIIIGLEPRVRYRCCIVSFPLQYQRIFSSPNTFDTYQVTFSIGYRFKV